VTVSPRMVRFSRWVACVGGAALWSFGFLDGSAVWCRSAACDEVLLVTR
jgi:hypothetical protein